MFLWHYYQYELPDVEPAFGRAAEPRPRSLCALPLPRQRRGDPAAGEGSLPCSVPAMAAALERFGVRWDTLVPHAGVSCPPLVTQVCQLLTSSAPQARHW